MDSTPGQRLLTTLVDIAFFILVGILAYHKVLAEQSILPILLMYARERFAVAQQKQWVQMVGPGGPTGGGGPTSNRPTSSTSQSMPAVSTPPSPPSAGPRARMMSMEPGGLVEIVRRYVHHPPSIAFAAIVIVLATAHGCGKPDARPTLPAAVVVR